jgi:hypothetical protein
VLRVEALLSRVSTLSARPSLVSFTFSICSKVNAEAASIASFLAVVIAVSRRVISATVPAESSDTEVLTAADAAPNAAIALSASSI